MWRQHRRVFDVSVAEHRRGRNCCWRCLTDWLNSLQWRLTGPQSTRRSRTTIGVGWMHAFDSGCFSAASNAGGRRTEVRAGTFKDCPHWPSIVNGASEINVFACRTGASVREDSVTQWTGKYDIQTFDLELSCVVYFLLLPLDAFCMTTPVTVCCTRMQLS